MRRKMKPTVPIMQHVSPTATRARQNIMTLVPRQVMMVIMNRVMTMMMMMMMMMTIIINGYVIITSATVM